MNTNEITLRQLFTAVVEGNITPAMQEKAKAEIAKLDATNAKRAEKGVCDVESTGGVYEFVSCIVEVDDVCEVVVHADTAYCVVDFRTQRGHK